MAWATDPRVSDDRPLGVADDRRREKGERKTTAGVGHGL
jgi:hypothetical protein